MHETPGACTVRDECAHPDGVFLGGGLYFYKMSTKIFSQDVYWMYSRLMCMEQRELRHDRHTVTLSTDHMVFSPKYRGKMLVEKTITLALDGIIRKTCKDLDIEIIDMAVNVD